mmetsp:Transcript_26454/g.55264  ORF Transcript_26454/g.55264 Transcript_26454/m.55264 type:complete len:227 (+) Transcript_26454:223-903(+)
MALAFWVDNRPNGIATTMSAHDEYLSLFSYYFANKTHYTMTPEDDFYSAPYCFMPKHRRGGFVVFTTRVPWLHGNPLGESVNERAHDKAREVMESRGKWEKPYLGTVEKFMIDLGLKEGDIYTFTDDGCYPTTRDISQALEDRAVEVTCSAMNWKIPENWRQIRKKEAENHGMPLLDLADWDRRQKIKNSNDDEITGNNVPNASCKEEDGDGREEKKDSTLDEYQC